MSEPDFNMPHVPFFTTLQVTIQSDVSAEAQFTAAIFAMTAHSAFLPPGVPISDDSKVRALRYVADTIAMATAP